MILIADSGSTKADWILVDASGNQIAETSTMGFNPYFHDKNVVFSALGENELLRTHADDVSNAYFYGAGCSTPQLKEKIAEGLSAFFKNAEVKVDHDLVAAAYATCGDEPGIACILGTGSNSCFYDGEEVHDDIPALGYILGDEGSGSYYGKKILRAFLYKELPARIAQKLVEERKLSKMSIFQDVYMKPNANVYLASFAKLLSDNREDIWVEDLVSNGMLEFIAVHVCRFSNYRKVPVHFVGSIAHYFEDVLRNVAERRHVNIGKIIKRPVTGLVEYHLRNVRVGS